MDFWNPLRLNSLLILIIGRTILATAHQMQLLKSNDPRNLIQVLFSHYFKWTFINYAKYGNYYR